MPTEDDDGVRNYAYASSSSSSSKEDDACIYFRVLRKMEDGGLHDWYVINSHTKSGAILSPALPRHPICPDFSTPVALGPVLYVLGGLRYHRRPYFMGIPCYDDVYWINTLHPENGWHEGPRMLEPRAGTYAAAINGKIYVIGDGYTEVLEHNNGWSQLQHVTGSHGGGHAILNGGKQILVNRTPSGVLYRYDTEADSWSIHDAAFGYLRCRTAFVDGILFCHDFREREVLYGYDVNSSAGALKPVIGLGDYLQVNLLRGLLNVGNRKVCMVFVRRSTECWDTIHVYCLKFRVSKKRNLSGEVGFFAHSLSLSDYYCKDVCTFLDCLAVFPYQRTEAQIGVANEREQTVTAAIDAGIRSISNTSNAAAPPPPPPPPRRKKNRKENKKKNKLYN